MDDRPKTKRRWFRYSLRTLLIFVTIASAGFAWLGVKVRQAHRQKEAVEAIRKLGGEVEYDYQLDSWLGRIKSPAPPGPTWLRELLGIDLFADVTTVYIFGPTFTDAEIVHLQEFTRLKALYLPQSQITDAGAVRIQQFAHLVNLDLSGTQITDAALVYLHGLGQLEQLDVHSTRVTVERCEELHRALPDLIYVNNLP